MPPIRAVHQVPDLTNTSGNPTPHTTEKTITATLNRLRYHFDFTPADGYVVDTPNAGTTVFAPGERMLFCGSGLYRVEPVPVNTLQPGDGFLGFLGLARSDEANIFDAVFVLRHRPQLFGDDVRLIPDPDRCHPAPYVFGVTYATPADRLAWKHIPTTDLTGDSAC